MSAPLHHQTGPVAALVLSLLVLSGCQSAPKQDLNLERVRTQLTQLQADEELAGYAQLALAEAERALRAAEQSTNPVEREHLIYMAGRRIELARAVAQREQLEVSLREMQARRSDMLVKASNLETQRARAEAEQARLMLATTTEDAERQRMEKELAQQQQAETARRAEQVSQEAAQARRLAESRASEAELARREAELASAQVGTLRRQLENLQTRQTEQGVVVTLGDVLFETGEVTLREEARTGLVEVVDLLQSDEQRQVRIEGHTDDVGATDANLRISQQRAEAVMAALAELGVASQRMQAVGMGEDYPVTPNLDEDSRSRNRRVDVILLDNN